MKKYFLIGICGASMSSLAIFLTEEGNIVRGYDRNRSSILDEHNIEVTNEENETDIDWADEVAFSSAFSEDFSLLKCAIQSGKKVYPRGKLLADESFKYERVVAVAGSHGKSTVTSMIYYILKMAGHNPSLHVGALLKETGRGFDIGEKEYFVTEACEYHDNFLFLRPYLSVVTNVEREHLDYFHSFSREKKSFTKFIEQSDMSVISTSFVAKNVKYDRFGRLKFDVYENGKKYMSLHLLVGGIYNAQNALYAIEAARKLGLSECQIKLGLESYQGLQKRFEKMNSMIKAKVFLDYAHHPHEIATVFDSIKLIKGKKVVLFQPHTYSRTRTLMEDFVKVLSQFDEVIVFKTYAAREQEDKEVERTLVERIAELKKVEYFDDIDALCKKLKKLSCGVLCVVGAGDLPEKLIEKHIIWRK